MYLDMKETKAEKGERNSFFPSPQTKKVSKRPQTAPVTKLHPDPGEAVGGKGRRGSGGGRAGGGCGSIGHKCVPQWHDLCVCAGGVPRAQGLPAEVAGRWGLGLHSRCARQGPVPIQETLELGNSDRCL